MIARQGDVLVMSVDAIPDGLGVVDRDQGRVVLAYGEVTGHCHAITEDAVTLFAPADVDDLTDRFLRVEREARLTHDEHATILLPPGEYVVRRQREYSSADQAPLAVGD